MTERKKKSGYAKEELTKMLEEWDQYHTGTYVDDTGNEMNAVEARKLEQQEIMQDELRSLQTAVKGKTGEGTESELESELLKVARKAYLAKNGIKADASDAELKKILARPKNLDDDVKKFLAELATEVTRSSMNYKQALSLMIHDKDPFGLKGTEPSKLLSALLSNYVLSSYESKKYKVTVDGKEVAQSERRYKYLDGEIRHPHHLDTVRSRYTPLFAQKGYHPEAGFDSSAQTQHILNEAANLMTIGKVSNVKEDHLNDHVRSGRRKQYKTGK